ncbi:MAG: flagellar hook-length control protein FliK [Lachnospiraceae bacterium]
MINQLNQQTTASGSAAASVPVTEEYAGGVSTLSGLKEGEVFEGTILHVENGKVTISLANGSSIMARLDTGVSLTQGLATFFQVKSNQGGQIELKAVTQNNSANPTLLRALTQAGVQVSERNLELVKEMMNQQLPIDTKSVLSMVRAANTFSSADVTTLTQLQKLSLPINELNIEQLEHYNRGEGQLQKSLETVIKALPDLIRQTPGQTEGLSVAKQILSLFSEELPAQTVQKDPSGGLQQLTGNAAQAQDLAAGTVQNVTTATDTGQNATATAGAGQNATMSAEQILDAAGNPGQETTAGRMTELTAGAGKVQDAALAAGQTAGNVVSPDPMIEQGGGVAGKTVQESDNPQNMAQASGAAGKEAPGMNLSITDVGTDSFAHMEMDSSVGMISGGENRKGADPAGELQRIIEWIDQGKVSKEELSELFGKRDFQDLLQNAVRKQWFITPQEVEDKQKLEKLYERIDRQMSKLQDIFTQAGQKDSSVTRQITDTRSNISFLNQLNHIYNYVQIPLRMTNQNATGDLYVYTNRKSAGKRDGELSAHLHLEMEHLGTTDVFVRLNNKKLATNFVMEDEKSLELVMEHIDILTARLQKKGYEVNVQIKEKPDTEQKAMFVQELLGQQQAQPVAVSRYSFDVKV